MKSNQLLDVLSQSGVLLNVSVRYWRGTKKLRPEDIGLEDTQLSDRLISLGHKRLLPKDATAHLALIESRAHSLVEANTFPFLNGLGHFLPNGRLMEATDKLRKLQSEFWQARENFVRDYAGFRTKAEEEWKVMAQTLVRDPERLVATISAAFPLPHEMDRKYGFDIQLFQISVPEGLSLDLITAAEQQDVVLARQRAARDASEKIRNDTQAFVGECVAALREQTAQLCKDMLHSMETCDTGVHQKTLNRLVRFIEQFKGMNFANDVEMEEQLESVRKELLTRSAEEYRDSSFARRKLAEGLEALGTRAGELARQDASHLVDRFGEMGRRKFNLVA